jgi:hypothetical protein
LVRQQSEEIERALWAAVRALEESSALSTRLAGSNGGSLRARFDEKSRALAHQAEVIREILLKEPSLSPTDAAKVETP